jgi:hypothetical protein
MARSVEEVEVDVAAVRAAHSDATEAARQARLAAEDLRRRAIADDGTVTAAALAAAEHESEFATLKIEARMSAVQALDAELAVARAERFADEFALAEQPLRQGFDQSMADLESALDRVVTAWRAHASLIDRTYQTAARTYARTTPRIRFEQYQHPSIDKTALRAIEVFAPVTAMVERTLGSLQRPL